LWMFVETSFWHRVPLLFWFKLLHFHFVNAIFYSIILLVSMASSNVHSLSMLKDDSDGGESSMRAGHPSTLKLRKLGMLCF
jgi:hypothetical protein